MSKKPSVFIFAPQGSGKPAYAAQLLKHFGLSVCSSWQPGEPIPAENALLLCDHDPRQAWAGGISNHPVYSLHEAMTAAGFRRTGTIKADATPAEMADQLWRALTPAVAGLMPRLPKTPEGHGEFWYAFVACLTGAMMADLGTDAARAILERSPEIASAIDVMIAEESAGSVPPGHQVH